MKPQYINATHPRMTIARGEHAMNHAVNLAARSMHIEQPTHN